MKTPQVHGPLPSAVRSLSRGGLQPPPPLGALSVPRFPPFERLDLDNGLRLAMVCSGQVPLTHAVAAMPVGGQDDPPGLEGLAALMLAAIKVATLRRSAQALTQAVQSAGADIASWVDWDSGVVSIETPTTHLDGMLELLMETALEPSFPEEAVERARRQQLTLLGQIGWRPERKAEAHFEAALYGDRIYGRHLLGSEDSVRRIQRQDLLDLHRGRVSMAGVSVALGGQMSTDRVRQHLAALPSDGQPEAEHAERLLELPTRRKMQVRLVDHVGASQSVLCVGHQGISRRDPRFHILRLLSQILTRRLEHRLRETLGMAYAVRTVLTARLGCGPMLTQTAVPHAEVGRAVQSILTEMRRLRDHPVGQQELQAAKNGFAGEFLRSSQTGRQLAIKLKQMIASRLADDHFDLQVQEVLEIDAEGLRAVAESCLFPQQAIVVAVGPKQEVAASFRSMGGTLDGAS